MERKEGVHGVMSSGVVAIAIHFVKRAIFYITHTYKEGIHVLR